MKTFLFSLLSVLAGFAGMCCSSLAGDAPALPELSLTPYEWGGEADAYMPVFRDDWSMYVGLELVNRSSWKRVWNDDGKGSVTLEDSVGNRQTVALRHWERRRHVKTDKGEVLVLDAGRWLPASGSRWVHVKGEVPVIVSPQDAVSEPVTVKLDGNAAVPVLLKGAGLADADGKAGDVKAELKVTDYEDAKAGGRKEFRLELSADRMLGVRKLEVLTVDGRSIVKISGDRNFGRRRGRGLFGKVSYYWGFRAEMENVPEGEVRVLMRYAQHPRRVMAGVDSRVALSGFTGGECADPLRTGDGDKAGRAAMAGGPALPAVPGRGPVTAKLTKIGIGYSRQDDDGDGRGMPLTMDFGLRLEVDRTFELFGAEASGKQSLELTDSSGRVLKPVTFDLKRLLRNEGDGCVYAVIHGRSPELSTPGVEWVRVKGTLRVPVGKVKTSPVYELPLVKGAEKHVPVPGVEMAGNEGDDVVAGEAPACRLRLGLVDRMENGGVSCWVGLSVGSVPFDTDGLELVDGNGIPLTYNVVELQRSDSEERIWVFQIPDAADMKQMNVRIRYREDVETVSVPVDVKVGLGGPLPQKEMKPAAPGRR